MKLPLAMAGAAHLLIFLTVAWASAVTEPPAADPIHLRLRRFIPPERGCIGGDVTWISFHPGPEPAPREYPWVIAPSAPRDAWEVFWRDPQSRTMRVNLFMTPAFAGSAARGRAADGGRAEPK